MPRRNPNAVLRLFCFHYAGGNAQIFRSWHSSLPSAVELYGVQLPGRASRRFEPAFTRISQCVPELSTALVPLLNKPFAFFGHSMGSLLSFEAARWLRRHKQILPMHLFLSGCRAPQIPDNDPPWHLVSDEELLAEILKLNGTPEEVMQDKSLLELALPILRADCELCETYKHEEEEPLVCPITVFSGTEDGKAGYETVEAWGCQTTGKFMHHVVEGDHFFLRSKEQELLKFLSAELSRLASSSSIVAEARPVGL